MLYIVVGKGGHLFGGLLSTEEEARSIATQIGGECHAMVEPWESIETRVLGQGKSPFGDARSDLTTMRVPRSIVQKVRKYAIWLAQN
jgi:hypothetical protein